MTDRSYYLPASAGPGANMNIFGSVTRDLSDSPVSYTAGTQAEMHPNAPLSASAKSPPIQPEQTELSDRHTLTKGT